MPYLQPVILFLLLVVKSQKKYYLIYDYFPKNRLGYLDNEIANYKDMNIYYSDEEIKKYGVVGFEIIKI